jgi:predicted transcriptional regulator YdeE
MEPTFVTEPPRRIVGLEYVGNNANKEIKALWGTYEPRIPEIKISGDFYGAVRMNDELPEGDFEYLAGVESDGDVPEGMKEWHLPGGLYAKVECPNLGELMPIIHGFYSEWLPASEYESGGGPTLEFYPESFPAQPGIFVLFSVKAR